MKEILLKGHTQELNVHSMFRKKYFVLIAIFFSILSYSQKYFLLDSLKANFSVKEYTLNTKEIYKIDKQIKIYNIFVSKNNILLLTVFPSLESKQGSWTVLEEKDFLKNTFSKNQILNLVTDFLEGNLNEKKTLKYNIVKKDNGKYFVSNLCLLEFFSIQNYLYPIISNESVINLSDKELSIKKMKESFEKQFPKENFILDIRKNDRVKNLDNQYIFKNYLSKKYKIKNQDAYQFWTFDGWWYIDGYNDYRGIDRFVYIPNIGIVGGSYDFYFEFKPNMSSESYYTTSHEDLWNNIINEKVMIAEELK